MIRTAKGICRLTQIGAIGSLSARFLENGGGDARQKNHVCEISPEFRLGRLTQTLRQFSGSCLAQLVGYIASRVYRGRGILHHLHIDFTTINYHASSVEISVRPVALPFVFSSMSTSTTLNLHCGPTQSTCDEDYQLLLAHVAGDIVLDSYLSDYLCRPFESTWELDWTLFPAPVASESVSDSYALSDYGRVREIEGASRTNMYFVSGDGIDREVITTDICRYLGNDALIRPSYHKVS